jgi:tryptophan synthase alpha chain
MTTFNRGVARIHGAFAKRKALITYLMAGDGDTVLHAATCAEAGADLIELGFPFSDPIADGPVIQRAARRSLQNGTTLPKVLELATRIRERVDIPLVLMGYLNPVLRFGVSELTQRAAASGIDGLILPDLPPDEAAQIRSEAAAAGLGLTFLVAPTTTRERERVVLEASTAFVYFVSVTGVTGVREGVPDVGPHVARIRSAASIPVAIGFGVSGPEQARGLAPLADGVIVGSAIIDRIEHGKPLRPFVETLRTSLETPC